MTIRTAGKRIILLTPSVSRLEPFGDAVGIITYVRLRELYVDDGARRASQVALVKRRRTEMLDTYVNIGQRPTVSSGKGVAPQHTAETWIGVQAREGVEDSTQLHQSLVN